MLRSSLKIPYVALRQNKTSLFDAWQLVACSNVTQESPNHLCRRSYYNFPVIELAQTSITWMHDITHLPWWATVMMATVTLRGLVTLPLAVHQAKVLAKIENLQPYVDEYSEALKHNVAVKSKREKKSAEEANKRFQKELRKFVYQLYKKEGCNPLKLYVLPWTQLPLWIVISLSLRNLSGYFPGAADGAQAPVAGFLSEGLLWFSDLSSPDALCALPVVLVLANLINIELNALRRQEPTTRQRIITNVMRTLSLTIGVVATQVPAGMSLYWTTSSLYGLSQNIVLKFPRARRLFGIPHSKSESKTPITDTTFILKDKIATFMQTQRR